ncbi:hypothetical protein GCM10027170_13260 [Aliiglaciecola aliphaticivorans]
MLMYKMIAAIEAQINTILVKVNIRILAVSGFKSDYFLFKYQASENAPLGSMKNYGELVL